MKGLTASDFRGGKNGSEGKILKQFLSTLH